MRAGLYIHYPFCETKCPYCHFFSLPWTASGDRIWREGLEQEAAAAGAGGLVFDTVYIGGGTPSLLRGDEVAAVMDIARTRFRLEISEFTLEANPCASDNGLFRGWRDAGVTRLSVGVQSFDDAILRTLGRRYSGEEAYRFCRSARGAGFDVLAVDLMVGVPGETPEAIDRSVAALAGCGPDHVSVYFLENVEGLPFAKVLERRPVDEDAAVENYERVKAALEAAGLRQYEISNFARAGRECRHNLKYWRYEPYLGLGPSACSRVGLERWSNKPALEDWTAALRRRESARDETVRLTPVEAAREALIFGLRIVQGVDVADLEARTGVNVCGLYAREIDELASEGLLIQAGARLWIPPDKLLISNAILSRFI
jgi:oxygen-independent coproporphyrinogen-3 oxidase